MRCVYSVAFVSFATLALGACETDGGPEYVKAASPYESALTQCEAQGELAAVQAEQGYQMANPIAGGFGHTFAKGTAGFDAERAAIEACMAAKGYVKN